MTPAEIQSVIRSGKGRQTLPIGTLWPAKMQGTVGRLTVNDTYYIALIGLDHNKAIESGGKPNGHFKFPYDKNGKQLAFCDDLYNQIVSAGGTGLCMNPTDTYNSYGGNTGGWVGSYAFKSVVTPLLNLLPAEWRSVIATTVKYTDNTGNGNTAASGVTSNNNIIFYLAEFEIQGKRTYANEAEQNYQQQYDFYLNGAPKIHYRHDQPNVAVYVNLRSPSAGSTYAFCLVASSGGATYTSARNSLGAAAAFGIH